jgi:hypothetical protein
MREPPRLGDGTEEPLAATLLRAARGYRRPAASRQRILRMLGLPIGVAAAAPASAAVTASLATKVVLLVSAATVVAGGGAVAYQVHLRAQGPRHVPAERGSTARDIETGSRRLRIGAAPTGSAPASRPALQAPPVAAVAAVELSSALQRPAPGPVRTRPARWRRALAGRLAAVSSRRALPSVPEVTITPSAASGPAPTAAARPTEPPATVAIASVGPLAREIALLDSAERADRRKDYGAARDSLDAYERAFPAGALLAEAQVLRISALLGSGDEAAARERARLFFERYSPSPLAARVRAMLAGRSGHTKEPP